MVAVTRSNTDASVIFEFLYKFETLLLQYFGDLTDSIIKDHFNTIYDLLDEVLEFGYPQSMDFNNLKNVVPPPKGLAQYSAMRPKLNTNKSNSKLNTHRELSTDIPWRKSDIKYRRNEIFLDVCEKINVLISKDGRIIKSYIDGHIDMKTHLSGMPVCKFGLNDSLSLTNDDISAGFLSQYDVKNKKAIPKAAAGSVILEDCKFHQCVQLDKFDTDRLINFIPPDGEFELMRYRASENINLPFKLTPMISETGVSNYEFRLNLKSLFPSKLSASDVVVKIPTPPGTIDVSFGSSGGKYKFSSEESAIIWKFNKFTGLTEHSITANISVAKTSATTASMNSSSRPPITLDFELLMFSSSGIVVRFLKVVEKSNYSTIKWVRYISQGGSYEIRY